MKKSDGTKNELNYTNGILTGITGTINGNGYMIIGDMPDKFGIVDVIFNPPYTIINWTDKTKTVVKQGDGDVWDAEKGFTWAVAKRALGTNGKIDKYIEEANKPQDKPKKIKKLTHNNENHSEEVKTPKKIE